MSRSETVFICTECGMEHLRWEGKCSACGAWHSLSEFKVPKTRSRRDFDTKYRDSFSSIPKPLAEISIEKLERISTGFKEFDRVLGGGFVPGSVVLLGGDPGIGKSTLLLQAVANIASPVLYISGEESAEQMKLRASRVRNAERVLFLAETEFSRIEKSLEESNCKVLVVDSIQTIYSADFPSSPGSVVQVRECAMKFLTLAKTKRVTVILVGHVTKEGAVAGPKVLEHIVDVVLYLEGDRYQSFRVLRGIKNRFGSSLELGVFEMTGEGLREVHNPSLFFLSERQGGPGSVVTVAMNGTRPFLVEVQALCTPTTFGYPKRTVSGFDLNRLNLLIAVLIKKAGVNLATQDIFINVVGGFKLTEPAADLAVCAAILSSFNNAMLPSDAVCFGEVGLSGEVRSVQQFERRCAEAVKLGYVNVFCSAKTNNFVGAKMNRISNISELIKILEC